MVMVMLLCIHNSTHHYNHNPLVPHFPTPSPVNPPLKIPQTRQNPRQLSLPNSSLLAFWSRLDFDLFCGFFGGEGVLDGMGLESKYTRHQTTKRRVHRGSCMCIGDCHVSNLLSNMTDRRDTRPLPPCTESVPVTNCMLHACPGLGRRIPRGE